MSTRLRAVQKALARAGKILPLTGGILVLADANAIGDEFADAFRDYMEDILQGNDETGSAAVVAGNCQNLAPGSGNIVLSYLLR